MLDFHRTIVAGLVNFNQNGEACSHLQISLSFRLWKTTGISLIQHIGSLFPIPQTLGMPQLILTVESVCETEK